MSKKQAKCGNPHIVKLLEEWRDDARNKGAKVHHTYSKAIKSFRKYPLPIRSGAEALILDGVGDMIARKLDEVLGVQHVTEGETCMSEAEHGGAASHQMCVPPPRSHKNKRTSGDESTNNRQKKQQKGREYIPGYRTGAYALIMTLFSSSQKPDYRGYMTKAELQREAQPLSETSFTLPDPGCRYTAWSSMSTLVKKGLVLKTSHPPRFSITDEGCALAYKLQTATQDCPTTSSSAVPFTIVPTPPRPVANATTAPGPAARQRAVHVELSSSSDSSDCEEVRRSTTQVEVNRLARSVSSDCEEVRRSTTQVEVNRLARSVSYDCEEVGRSTLQAAEVNRLASSVSSHNNDCEEIGRFTKQADVERLARPDDHSRAAAFKPKFVLRPSMFDVVLCVDVCEIAAGAAKSSKDNLLPELRNNGVEFDVRKLQVGDFLWVARERTAPIPGRLSVPTPRELVLDYIAERKRMDDLCQSITDGRFREQKFRLRQCGLKQPIYLVEKFGSSQHLSLPESTLEQAIVNTQVIDRFFVKRTQDLKESVAYLTLMTRHLQKMYANKTLIGCEMELISEMKSSADVLYLLTFDEFNQSAVKNKVMTVREMFGKQLMQISGVSADKAAAILDKYPTPALLLQAYARQTSEKDRESMLSQLKSGKNQRNLGPALSKLVHQMYCT